MTEQLNCPNVNKLDINEWSSLYVTKYLVGDVVPLSRQWQILYGNRTSQASEMMSLVSFAASQKRKVCKSLQIVAKGEVDIYNYMT